MLAYLINTINIIELFIEWVLIAWIVIATVRALKKVAPVPSIKQTDLMKGLWKLEIAFGFALIGLAGLGTIAAIYYLHGFGLVVLAVTLTVFLLIHSSTKDLEKVPLMAEYTEKIKKWKEKKE